MKVKFFCDSGANIHSKKNSGWLDTSSDLGYTDDEWADLSDEDKYKEAEEWAWNNGLEVCYKEQNT